MPVDPTTIALITDINTALSRVLSSAYTTPAKAPDVYEAYIFSLVVQAAESVSKLPAQYKFGTGSMATDLVFRTSPGQIYKNLNTYTHAELPFAKAPTLEAHVGIYVTGRSGVAHECDVAVISKGEADTCRAGNGLGKHHSPRVRNLALGVECKYYSTGIRLHNIRSFLGLRVDLTTKRLHFVSNTTRSDPEKVLASRAAGQWSPNVSPSSPDATTNLLEYFKRVFRDYQASQS